MDETVRKAVKLILHNINFEINDTKYHFKQTYFYITLIHLFHQYFKELMSNTSDP